MTLPAPSDPEPSARPAEAVRKIVHIDMDAFYASVEQRDDPALRGKPVAVGGAAARGVVAAASYEARRFGVRSAMASLTARRLCPDLVFVPPRFDVYRAVSRQVHAIFADFTEAIEPLSLDEAYLDVTVNHKGIASATRIAEAIRARIKAETGLTASAGVSYNKFLAKIASDYRKPDGLWVIPPAAGPDFVAELPVRKFHGVGPVTAARMERLGLMTGADLRAQTLDFLRGHFGKAGDYYHDAARGIDHRPVRADRARKSIGSESTFPHDLTTHAELVAALEPAVESVWRHCSRAGLSGRTVTLKAKYADFRIVTRSHTYAAPVTDAEALRRAGQELLGGLFPLAAGIRLLGLTLSNFSATADDAAQQLPLAL